MPVSIRTLWGPAGLGKANESSTATFQDHDLDDADDAAAWKFCIPMDGTITKVGFYVTVFNGAPPDYYVGLVTLDAAGAPTQVAYGGSAITTYSPTGVGWVWVTLATPATAVAGELCAVHIWPTGVAPDAANSIDVAYEYLTQIEFPTMCSYTVAWAYSDGYGPWAVQYDDGTIVGMEAIAKSVDSIDTGTTPDEEGCLLEMPFDATCFGARINMSLPISSASYDVVLYDSLDNVLASVSVDDEDKTNAQGAKDLYWDDVSLDEGSTYRLVLKPTSLSNIIPAGAVFDTAAGRAGKTIPEGDRWQKTERTDAGAWTNTDDELIWMGLWLNSI